MKRTTMADIRHAIEISASPETIYPLVATQQGFKQWWAEDVWEENAEVNLGFFERQAVFRLRRVEDAPPRDARWSVRADGEWDGTQLIFAIESDGAASRLRFTHAGWAADTPYFVDCNTTWGELMFRLKDAAEGRTCGALFTARG